MAKIGTIPQAYIQRQDIVTKFMSMDRITIGVVREVYPYTNFYTVADQDGVQHGAIYVPILGGLPVGARQISVLLPGTLVLMYVPPSSPGNIALIIGAMLDQVGDSRYSLPDSVVLRGGGGLHNDPAFYTRLTMPRANMIGDFSAGIPVDSLPGDIGWLNDLGVGWYLGRLMAMLRASDAAKVEVFYGDDLLRLVSYNFEHYLSGKEVISGDDEGEYSEIELMTPHIFEATGVSRPSDATDSSSGLSFRKISDKEAILKPGGNNNYAYIEPKYDDQHGIFRFLRFSGYLGDGYREMIAIPPVDLAVERFSNKTRYLGVFERVASLDGAYTVRSAKSLSLRKTVFMPVPKRLKHPSDMTGDNVTNYASDGYWNADKAVQLDFSEFQWAENTSGLERIAQLPDYAAYTIGTRLLRTILYHEKDWYVPQPSEIDDIYGPITEYETLGSKFLADYPPFVEFEVDHRINNSRKYYHSEAGFDILDDGTVVIDGGYGEQIVMTGGSIFFMCPGDIWFLPGRNFITWAPHDAILRAGNSADITAAKHDVRLKAERNLHMLSGNSGQGSLLLENRGIGVMSSEEWSDAGESVLGRGIVLKSAEANVMIWGKSVHVGLSNESGNSDSLTLDGRHGNIVMRGMQLLGNFEKSMYIDFKDGMNTLYVSSDQSALVGSKLTVGGNLAVVPMDGSSAGIMADGIVYSTEGFVTRHGSNLVGKATHDPDTTPKELAVQANEAVDNFLENLVAIKNMLFENETYSPGSSGYQQKIGFSCRVKEDYGLEDDFYLPEASWQNKARRAGYSVVWDEPEIIAPSGIRTRPHPGNELWTSKNLVSFELRNVKNDLSMGDRPHQKEAGAKTTMSFESGYLITLQEG